MNRSIGKCGDANPNGNISLFYKGACKNDLLIADAYRCTGCKGWFHKDCILNHFELESVHDWGRNEERKTIIAKIKKYKEKYGEEFSDKIATTCDDILSYLRGGE